MGRSSGIKDSYDIISPSRQNRLKLKANQRTQIRLIQGMAERIQFAPCCVEIYR